MHAPRSSLGWLAALLTTAGALASGPAPAQADSSAPQSPLPSQPRPTAEPAERRPAPSAELQAGAVLRAFDESGTPLEFRIDGVETDPDDRAGELRLYTIAAHEAGGDWRPYCEPDAQGRSRAVALQGSWDLRGRYLPSSRITFGCTSGAIGKCVRWGYRPWTTVAGRSLRPLHLACVRMVRADYCGDGRAHTRDGTFIDVFDRLGVQQREAVPDRPVLFEAGWSPDGATYLAHPRWGALAAIVAECPGRLHLRSALRGPRLSAEEVEARFPETVLFNDNAPRVADRLRR